MILRLAVIPAVLFSATVSAQQGQMPDPVEMLMKRLDTNGDGGISLAEFRAPGDAMFKEMDANADGVVDRQEASRFNAMMMRKMEEMRKQHGGQMPRGGPQGAPGGYPR